jgi:methionine synthase I (cobalamin-dependent)
VCSPVQVAYAKLRGRLHQGRPLVLDADVGASLRARGFEMDGPGALGAILHREPRAIAMHHQAELSCKVDILSALTADTTPRALAEAGMEHRAARLTGIALELIGELVASWSRPIGVAGVLGSELVSATQRGRFEDETLEHAARIAAGGAELMIIRGMGSRIDLVFAVAAAAAYGSAWAVVDRHMATDAELPQLALSLADAGAEAVLLEVESAEEGLRRLRLLEGLGPSVAPGTLLSAAPDALRGFPSPLLSSWVDRAVELTASGARIVGGGAGTTEDHTRALASRLGMIHPSLAAPHGRPNA